MAKLKLSREQITKGLEQIPMETILQGVSGSIPNLTNKQIEFAKELALGKGTKVGAYRKAYGAKGSPKSVGSRASVLSTDQRIQVAVDAFKAAEAYREYQTPTQLRALVVSQLTQHVLDEDFPPAQRVQCLKLLGSVAEIGLFVDRKETLVVHKSDDIRQRLLDQLKNVINNQAEDITPNSDADSLLAELSNKPDPVAEISDSAPKNQELANDDPTVPVPPDFAEDHLADYIHTIPHESSLENSVSNESPTESSVDNKDAMEGDLVVEGKEGHPPSDEKNGTQL